MTLLGQFNAIQKRAVKWINGEPFTSYTDERFEEEQRNLNILPVKQKFIYNDLMLFFKIVNSMVPISLPPYLVVQIAEDTRVTRRNAQIVDQTDTSTYRCSIPVETGALRNSFFCRSMRRWNSLPVPVRQAGTISKFKKYLLVCLWSAETVWPD